MARRAQSLQRRLLWLTVQLFALGLVVLSAVGVMAFRAQRLDAEEPRLALAAAVAVAIDAQLRDQVQRISELSRRLQNDPETIRGQLRAYRLHDRLRQSLVLVDADGRTIAADPPTAEGLTTTIDRGADYGSIRIDLDATGGPLIVLQHNVGRGAESPRLIATMDARGSVLTALLSELVAAGERHAAVVDERGMIVASTHDEHVGLSMSHSQQIARGLVEHGPTIWSAAQSPICADDPQPLFSILVPLQTARWGLLVQEHESSAVGASTRLGWTFLIVGLGLSAGGGLLALTMSRSIASPLALLSNRAAAMRDGDLETPIDVRGDREIVLLAGALDAMRHRLRDTLEQLAHFNRDLESKVEDRTRRLAEGNAERKRLVRRLLDAGEDERRRIARELHDETAQMLTAIQLALDSVEGDSPAVARATELLRDTQREIHRVIHDLRPTLLDDLGLAAAIRSYCETHLSGGGIQVDLSLDRLPSRDGTIDTALFRVFQELVTNILRHAAAGRVSIELYTTDGMLRLEVEDDGRGFDPLVRGNGVGITGMRERIALVGGTMRIDSEPAMGAHVVVEVPLQS